MPLARPAPAGPTRWLGHFRWAFMPLGLCALVAVGVHAAADTVDDRLLGVIDSAQARWDSFWSAWSWGEWLVSPFGLSARTVLARGATLVWELGSDLVLALPMLAYREVGPAESGARSGRPRSADQWVRALVTLPIVLAGACAAARLIQGTAFLSLHGETTDSAAEAWSRLVAILSLGLVLATLGWRASLLPLARRAEGPPASASYLGLLWVAPLAVAAAQDATPLRSFFH